MDRLPVTPSLKAGVIIQGSAAMEVAAGSNCTAAVGLNNPSFQTVGLGSGVEPHANRF